MPQTKFMDALTEALREEMQRDDSVFLLGEAVNGSLPAEAVRLAFTGDTILIGGIGRNDFYILCPDNETTREQDERRILWSAGDLIENRPALSRWHPDYAKVFEEFMKSRHQ